MMHLTKIPAANSLPTIMPTSPESELVFVIPDFVAASRSQEPERALQRLLAYGGEPSTTESVAHLLPWQVELLRAVGLSVDCANASAPLTWLGATGEFREGL